MKKIILSIEGMTCSACSNGLEKKLKNYEGIVDATVNLVMATASISYLDNVSISEIEDVIKKAGFKSLGEANLEKTEKGSVKPFIIYGILAFVLMYVSMASMLKLPIIKYLDMSLYPKIYGITLFALTIPFLIFGKDIIRSGFSNLIHKMPNMDTLVSIGVFSSFIYSVINVILVLLGHEHFIHNLYFESTAFVLFFIKLGRYIDRSSKNKTKDVIQKLVVMTPKVAKIKDGDSYKDITIDLVKKGDILVCLPGDKFAVDGKVVSGSSHVDEAFITGESKPVSKEKGDNVVAGSINFEGKIYYEAERVGKESTISEIVNLVLDATNTKAPIAQLADKISSYFVPTIIIISVLTFIINLLFNVSLAESLKRFVTVLVVACPCSLGLATPLAIVVSEGNCAKKGILVKESKVFEIANKIDTVVFDKTGILTKGKLMISKVYNYSKLSDNKLLELLGNIEINSTHPIAKGVINSIMDLNINIKDNMTIENLAGYGIKATLGKDIYYACNSKKIKLLKIKNTHLDDEEKLQKDGNSIIYVVKNNEILGLIGIKDLIRDESKEVIKTLKENNYEVIMLTGDNSITAKKIGKELGITNIISEVVPKEKSNVIKKLKDEGKKVIMVGDGINDAPSLTLADIGISIMDGTDIATFSADVILMNNNLNRINDLLNVSKKTLINIKENLFWAFIYNIIMVPVATGMFSKLGLTINPMIACIFMICSSLFVIFNSLRLKNK